MALAKPTLDIDKTKNIYQYVVIEGYGIEQGMLQFNLSRRSIYEHLHRYRVLLKPPDDYIEQERDRYRKLAGLAQDVLTNHLQGDTPDPHVALRVIKDSGIAAPEQSQLAINIPEITPEQAAKLESQLQAIRSTRLEARTATIVDPERVEHGKNSGQTESKQRKRHKSKEAAEQAFADKFLPGSESNRESKE